MRRIRLGTGPGAIFAALLVLFLLVFLPMRLALGWVGLDTAGFTARKVSGSVWDGRLTEARFGDVALGDLRAGLSPLQLLVGRARIDLAGQAGGQERPLTGAIGLTRHSLGLDDVTGALPVGRVFAPVPVTLLDLDDVTVRFVDGNCDHADGRVRAVLAGDFAGVAVPGSLAGTARCDGGALYLPLGSQGGGEGVALRLWQDGRYRAELTLAPSDPAAAAKLAMAGFGQTASGYQLSIEGRF